MWCKILKVERSRVSLVEFDYTRFDVEYETKKWYWFGRTKIVKTQVSIADWKAASWLAHTRSRIGVWDKL